MPRLGDHPAAPGRADAGRADADAAKSRRHMARLASLDSETLAFGTGIARFARKPRGRGRPLPASGCGPGAGREIAGRSGQRGLGYPNDMAKKSSGARKRGGGTRVRDAVTGRFLRRGTEKRRPKTTLVERITRRRPRKKR